MEKNERGVWKKGVAYSSASFGLGLLSMIISTLLMYYYTDVMEIPALVVSLILFTARIFDGVVDPFIGYYMDRRTTRFGKYKGYIFYWCPLMCVVFVMMFLNSPFDGNGKYIWCILIYLVFTFSYSIIETATLPMLASFRSKEGRSIGVTAKMSVGILATLIATTFSLSLVEQLGRGSEQQGYSRMAILFSIVVLIVIIVGTAFFKEGKYNSDAAVTSDRKVTTGKAISTVLKDKKIVFLLCMHICLEAASAFKMQAGIYYLKYTMDRQDLTSFFLASSIGISLLTQPLIFYLSKRANWRMLMAGGCGISAVALFIVGMSGSSVAVLIIGNCIFGMASAFPANLVYLRMTNLSEELSIRKGVHLGAVANSFLGLAARIGSSLASGILSFILFVTAYTPNAVQSSQAIMGILVGFVVMPILVLLLGGIFIVLSYREVDQDPPREHATDFSSSKV